MVFGDQVGVGAHSLLIVPDWRERGSGVEPAIVIGSRTSLGVACTISAINRVSIGNDVLFGPRVWITDHNHEFRDVTRPIHAQGRTAGGFVEIEDNCWIGTGAVVVGARGIRIGKGSVIGANSVVVRSVAPFSVVAGNPARVIRQFDADRGDWRRVDEPDPQASHQR